MIHETTFLLGTFSENLALLIQEHLYLISALTPIVGGEVGLHMVGAVSGSNGIIAVPFLIAVASVVTFDVAVYCTVKYLQKRYSAMEKIKNIRAFIKCKEIFQRYERRLGKNLILLLVVVKLLPATKITMIFVAARTRIPVVQFLLKSIISTTIYALILFPPGWLIGKGLLAQEMGRNMINLAFYLAVLLAIMIVFGDRINSLILKFGGKIVEGMKKQEDRE